MLYKQELIFSRRSTKSIYINESMNVRLCKGVRLQGFQQPEIRKEKKNQDTKAGWKQKEGLSKVKD